MLKRIIKENRILIGILFGALVLRLIGITHGFPYIFHPDEPTVVRSALGVRFFPNPKHFDWPHLYIYLNYFVYMAFAAFRKGLDLIGLRPFVSGILPLIWEEELIFYLITRVFSASLGALTVIPVYLAGGKLFNKRVGLLAALALAIFPFHVHHSHYSLTDVPMVFFGAWVVYFSSNILLAPKIRDFLLAGFFVGLAASTKYNGAIFALVVALAYFGHYMGEENGFSRLFKNSYKPFLSGVLAFLGFLVGTPYALFDYKTFSRTDGPKGAYWQFTNVGSVSFRDQVFQFFSAFPEKFASDWSWAFVILFVAGLLYFLYKLISIKFSPEEAKKLLLLYLPSLAFLFYISGFSKNRSHYYMVAYPLIALIIGWVVSAAASKLSKRPQVAFLFLVFLLPLIGSTANAVTFARTDTRILTENWYLENIHPLDVEYAVYYSSTHLRDVFTKYGSSYPAYKKEREYPYFLVSFCEGEDPRDPIYFQGDFLRRGDEICVYYEAGESLDE